MKNNPLIDAGAILICLLAVIAVGHYMKSKKEQENSLQQVEKRVELKEQARPKIDLSKFEAAVKTTE